MHYLHWINFYLDMTEYNLFSDFVLFVSKYCEYFIGEYYCNCFKILYLTANVANACILIFQTQFLE